MKLDKEYGTCYLREVNYLKSKGIKWSFVKTEDNTRIYKFTKTKELFLALAEYYDK